MQYELMIESGKSAYLPNVESGISWETERKGTPGKLTFQILKDAALSFLEGDTVSLRVNGSPLFYGFVFAKKRDKEGLITVTAYDQLRYLKNKDTYCYSNKTASEVIAMIGADFRLQLGTVEDTQLKIPSRVEDNQTLFDIIQTALDITMQERNQLYVLYDAFGRLTLQNVQSMVVNLLIDGQGVENFDYTSSIDGETYNKIKLAYNNEKTGKRDLYIAQDSANMNQWGVLQYFETIDEAANGKAKADALLKLYNQKTRSLTVKGVFGDIRVRGGSLVPVSLDLGDVVANSYMLVEKVKHQFEEGIHTMDITLRGGDFYA